MTQDEIKKALRCCKNQCCSFCPHWCEKGCRYQTLSDALTLITEQEKSIQEAQDSILSLAQQNQEYREQQVKQAKIDVLNELRRRAWQGYQIGMYIVSTQEIDELVREVENE